MALWHHNRSLRCAGLRCIIFYLHCVQDVNLLLASRLDILIARLFSLFTILFGFFIKPEDSTHWPYKSSELITQNSVAKISSLICIKVNGANRSSYIDITPDLLYALFGFSCVVAELTPTPFRQGLL
ncbi:unnamed protein product [Protopolystoma xenopodis]|uniref:Uncharacterized protein n=1 Tax=Protopolystoma xenopodis TaxID=117903 RepID=A0A3S5BNX6_9PLAT|nr:unnamed protein product [Protopolystoma xenopodis]